MKQSFLQELASAVSNSKCNCFLFLHCIISNHDKFQASDHICSCRDHFCVKFAWKQEFHVEREPPFP